MGPSASGVQRSIPSSARWLTSPRRCPNASAAVMGRRKRAGVMRTGRGKISTERASGSSRGADMPRWIASSSSRRRRTWGTRNSVAGWMTLLTTLAFLMLGTPLTHMTHMGVRGWTQPWRLGVTAGQLSARLPIALPFALAHECGCARGIPPPESLPLYSI